MARTVADAAILFGALEDAQPDPNDPVKNLDFAARARNYTRFLNRDGLKGARIGIPRAFYYERVTPSGLAEARGGLNTEQAKVMAEAISILKEQGAIIVDDPANSRTSSTGGQKKLLRWPVCSGTDGAKGKDATCSVVFKYGMKRDFNKWIASLGPAAPVKSLTALRDWNLAHRNAGALKYGQSQLDISDEMDVEADRARYEADRAKDLLLSGAHGVDEIIRSERLDAILFPAQTGALMLARPGYPTVIVPFGMVPNAPTPPISVEFGAKSAPFGVSFAGTACSEPRLIELAYAFEQATTARSTCLIPVTEQRGWGGLGARSNPKPL